MKTYENAKAAHEANNEVMLAARRMAEERGLVMAIVVAGANAAEKTQTVGVEYTRLENLELVLHLSAFAVGVLTKQQAEEASDWIGRMVAMGHKASAAALDRGRVGDEPEAIDSERRDNPLCPHCGDEADGEELFEDEEGAVDGDERTTRCHACKQEYVATHHVTITYSTRKP